MNTRGFLAMRLCILFFGFLCSFFVANVVSAATFVVNTNEDSNDGACTSIFGGAAADCTLREAIVAANAAGGADTIEFDIDASFADDGDGQWTITLASALSALTGQTTISGASAWDADDDRPGLKISRVGGAAAFTFNATATSSKVQGLEFSGHTVAISIGAASMTVGTDCDGVDDARERNVLYGATTEEILVSNVSGAKIRGNYIGVLSDGVTASTFGLRGIRLNGASADNNIIGYEEGTSGTCAASLQRNVIGGGDASSDIGVFLTSSAAVALAGNAATGPNGNRISGNYIGIGADGMADVTGDGTGVQLRGAATLNYVGTDGDGADDDLEGNVVSGWLGAGPLLGVGITVLQTGNNLIAGNVIGFAADGVTARGNGSNGMNVRGTSNVIGWCDTSVHATLCANGGSVGDERNISGNNGQDGIRFGFECDDCIAYGNISGTDETLTVDAGNADNGFFVHRGNTGVVIGGAGDDRRNTVMFNDDAGIKIDGLFTSSSSTTTPNFASGPTDDYTIENNFVSQNDGHGIYLYLTELEGSEVGPTDGEVLDNTVTENGLSGIFSEGSAPVIDGNTTDDNGTYGIEVASSYHPDDPPVGEFIGLVYSHPTDSLNPNEASEDLVSAPIITDNAIDGNTDGGIFILDADVDNMASIVTDNAIGLNGEFDVRRDWYLGVEVVDQGGVVYTDGPTVTLTPANGLACTGTCTGSTFASAGGGEGIFGPVGISYTDAATWFQITELAYDTSGALMEYNPYAVSVSGGVQIAGTGDRTVTVDGDASDEGDTAHLPAGITTASVDRYQIHELIVRGSQDPIFFPPAAPSALTPVALRDTTIRWHFRDEANNETGFRLYAHEETGERLITDVGSPDQSFIDETGLAANTQYCDRFMVAYNGVGESFRTVLPCAATLAAGETAKEIGIPDVRITQRVFFLDRNQVVTAGWNEPNVGYPMLLFGSVLIAGALHAGRKQRRSCTIGECTETLAAYAVFGLFGAILLCLLLSPPWGVVRSVAQTQTAMRELSTEMEVRPGDRLLVRFDVENRGAVAALNLTLVDYLSSLLILDETSVRRDGIALTPIRRADAWRMSLGSQPAGDRWIVTYELTVGQGEESLTHVGTVTGDNIPPTTSNSIPINIAAHESVGFRFRPFTLVTAPSSTSVYMIDTDGTRRPFPDLTTFFSWYDRLSYTRTIMDQELASIPLGAPMLPRPGTWLVSETGSDIVYAVEPGNVLRQATTEPEQVFGRYWDQQVYEVDPALWRHYTVGEPLGDGERPDGMLITDGSRVCYLDNGLCRPVSQNGLFANRFFDHFIRRVPTRLLDRYGLGETIVESEPALLTDTPH